MSAFCTPDAPCEDCAPLRAAEELRRYWRTAYGRNHMRRTRAYGRELADAASDMPVVPASTPAMYRDQRGHFTAEYNRAEGTRRLALHRLRAIARAKNARA